MNGITKIYPILLKNYGPQGWWPLTSHKGKNPTKTGSIRGYHPGDYSFPRNKEEQFEVCIGAILTQNTAWANVEKALINLKKLKAINPKRILSLDDEILKNAIKPAGYFNQKAKKLKIFSEFYIKLKGKTPSREELLNLWGVGPETADSILLYAYKKPIFVVDAYSKRIFSRAGFFKDNSSYEDIQSFFYQNLKSDERTFNEFHALIVEHAKRYCKKKPECKECIIKTYCLNKN